MDNEFKLGDKVGHILNKEYLLVICEGEWMNKYLCRIKDFIEIWFYAFELRKINDCKQ